MLARRLTIENSEAMGQTNVLSEGSYEMLRAAVNTAREHQCNTLERLKERLLTKWPNRTKEIDEAINYWAADVQKRHPAGVPRRGP